METKKTSKSYLRVLAHKFNTWNEAHNYIVHLLNRGECKVLPKIVQYTEVSNGKMIKGWSWTPYINDKGELHFN